VKFSLLYRKIGFFSAFDVGRIKLWYFKLYTFFSHVKKSPDICSSSPEFARLRAELAGGGCVKVLTPAVTA
jgi:hypothetical protein